MISCSPGKKLQAALAQNNQLTSELTTTNSNLANNEKKVVHLNQENIQYAKEAKDCNETKKEQADRIYPKPGSFIPLGNT